jgi:hypothetical protein
MHHLHRVSSSQHPQATGLHWNGAGNRQPTDQSRNGLRLLVLSGRGIAGSSRCLPEFAARVFPATGRRLSYT